MKCSNCEETNAFVEGVFNACLTRGSATFPAACEETLALLNRPNVQEAIYKEIGPFVTEWWEKKKCEFAARDARESQTVFTEACRV